MLQIEIMIYHDLKRVRAKIWLAYSSFNSLQIPVIDLNFDAKKSVLFEKKKVLLALASWRKEGINRLFHHLLNIIFASYSSSSSYLFFYSQTISSTNFFVDVEIK